MALLRLFDPTTQFQTKSGALNVAGKLRIYVENTDDLANIYGDDGSLLSQPLILDSNGRARGLFVDSGRSYRLEAYDRNDSLLFTIRRLEPNASGTIINPTVFIKGTPDEIDVEDFVTEESRTYTVSLSAKVTGEIAENREAIVKESEARKYADDELRKMIDNNAEAGTASPLMDGEASVGNSLKYAREDHVHPSDTSKEDKANKTTVVLGTSDSKYPTDKAVAEFVNSSIATNTANYISNNGEPFTSVEQLEAYSGPVTNNDYAFVTGTDSEGNTYYDRYKATVSGSTVTWALEYRLNNSSFTAAQWSAINSGITSVLVAKIHDHSNKDVLDGITSDKVNSWDAKASTSVATTSANGLMSKTDKSKLDGISSGANKADVSYASKKLTKTINGTTTDVVAASTIISDTNTFGNFAAVTDVNIDRIIYHTYWQVPPTSSNQVYGVAAHPSNGLLYRIHNLKGKYYAYRYDSNTTYTFDGTYDRETNKAATVSSITTRIATAKEELTAAIDSEASARESADTALQSNIDTVGAKGIVINEINGENVICFE